jgi:hypothetical protein
LSLVTSTMSNGTRPDVATSWRGTPSAPTTIRVRSDWCRLMMNRSMSATLATVVPGAAGKLAPRGKELPTAVIERQISRWPQLSVSTPLPSPSNGTRMVSAMIRSR